LNLIRHVLIFFLWDVVFVKLPLPSLYRHFLPRDAMLMRVRDQNMDSRATSVFGGIYLTISVTTTTTTTRHRASTSMHSLAFRVRVTTPPQYGRNGTAHAAGASILSLARAVFAGMRSVRVRHACGVRWAWRITAGLCHRLP